MATEKMTFELPERPTLYNLEVVVTQDGDVLCGGRLFGRASKFGKYLTPKTTAPMPIAVPVEPNT